MNNRRLLGIVLALATTLIATHVVAQDIGSPDAQQLKNLLPKRPYSPYAGRNFATRVFWGDTHLHTGLRDLPRRRDEGEQIGQLLFVGAVVMVVALCARLPARPPRWSAWVPPYAIGTVAMFWVAERVAAF
jgi:hypothetical protein